MVNVVQIILKMRDGYSTVIKRLNKNLMTTAKSIMPSVATAARVMGVAIVAALGLSIKAAAEFQSQMANVNTMLDEQGTRLLPQLAKSVSNMAVQYGEGTKTLTDGLYDILSASIPVEKSIKVLDTSVRAAKAGMTDTGTAADALTTILNSFQISADKAGDVSDLLFSIVKRGKTTFAQLAPAIGMVASNAAASGLSLEEMGAALATMTRMGIRTEISTTSLRAIINSMIKPTDEAAAAFRDKLGMSMTAATLSAEGLSGIIAQIKEKGLTAEEVAAMFPNVRALTGINALLKGHAGLMKDVGIMHKRAGATQEAFTKQTKKFEFQMKRAKEAINLIRRIIGAHFMPILTKLSKNFADNREDVIKWAKQIGSDAAKAFMTLVNVIRALTPIIVALVPTLRIVGGAILQIFNGVSMAIESLLAFIKAEVALLGVVVGKIWGIFSEEGKAFEAEAKAQLAEVSAEWTTRMNQIGKETEGMFDGLDIDLSEFGIDVGDPFNIDPAATKENLEEATMTLEQHMAKIAEIVREAEERNIEIKTGFAEYANELDQATLDQKLTLFDAEVEAKRAAMLDKLNIDAKELEEGGKFAARGKKMTEDEQKARTRIVMAHAQARIAVAHGVATDLLQLSNVLLGGESEAFRKRKALTIALILAEKALAIAKIWTANAVNPIAAAAKTALIAAKFGAQIKGLEAAAATAEAVPGVTVGAAAGFAAGGEAPTAAIPTAAGTVGGVGAGGGGGGAMTAVFHLGGVHVNFDVDKLESMELQNLENLMTQIADAIRDKSVEGFDMAMTISRTGELNPGLAV